jgi:hypothetical protein
MVVVGGLKGNGTEWIRGIQWEIKNTHVCLFGQKMKVKIERSRPE